jgi:hypothetical protein
VQKEYLVHVEDCDRCEGEHDNMMFRPLRNATGEYTFYGLCPETTQPVLMTSAEMGE